MGFLVRVFGGLRSFWSAGLWQKALLLTVTGGAVYAIASLGGAPAADTSIAVTRGSISQTVSVTGQLQSTEEVELSFQSGGRIARVDARVGDRVTAGQILASLDNSETAAQLRDAEATVIARQAQLEEMELGGSPQELAIAEADVRAAEQDLQSAYDNTYRELYDAYNSADQALRITLRPLFTGGNEDMNPSYDLTFDTNDYTSEAAAINARADAEAALRDWQVHINTIASGGTFAVYNTAIIDVRGYANRAAAAVTATAKLFDGTSTLGLDEDTENEYRSLVTQARGDVVGALITINNLDQDIKNRATGLEQARTQLAYTRDSATPQTLNAQRAAVLSAQANADRFRALIAKGTIRSPIDGIVTQQDAKVGQTAAGGEVLVSIISDQQLEIEANVPEVDIGQVSVGDTVAVTVDALPGESFSGSVIFIEPAETVVDGVVNFKVTAMLSQPDIRLKSGLTVNLDIETARYDDVLLLPQFAIIENDDGTFVRGLDGNEVPVTLGIRSQDGMVEVASGLTEGERVQNIGLKPSGN